MTKCAFSADVIIIVIVIIVIVVIVIVFIATIPLRIESFLHLTQKIDNTSDFLPLRG